MRAHKLSWKMIALCVVPVAVLLPAAIVYGHPDAVGTRFVSPATRDGYRRLQQQPQPLPARWPMR